MTETKITKINLLATLELVNKTMFQCVVCYKPCDIREVARHLNQYKVITYPFDGVNVSGKAYTLIHKDCEGKKDEN